MAFVVIANKNQKTKKILTPMRKTKNLNKI